jgi:hypothetical protein
MVATSIFFIVIIASKARLASSPPAAQGFGEHAGCICQDRPQRLCTIRTRFLAAVIDDGIPIAVCFS